tara:strand:- start:346 stop:507 length:162 start_codon:yes stop_codon:yes gene_type:complete
MRRFNVFLEIKQINFLEKLPGKVSEHVRIAVGKYIQEMKGLNASASQSGKAGE